jgi:hypothetical protein
MKYAVEMIYISSFMKIDKCIQKLVGGHTGTHREHGARVSLLLIFQNSESKLIEI